jgi:hypothetical protein
LEIDEFASVIRANSRPIRVRNFCRRELREATVRASRALFSPDGAYGYVCSSFTPETVVVGTRDHKIVGHVKQSGGKDVRRYLVIASGTPAQLGERVQVQLTGIAVIIASLSSV